MLLNKNKHKKVEQCLSRCLPDFQHINHYWDNNMGSVIAKILPGEFYMTRDNVAIATTLGSCVSACIWDEVAGIGGMNHFMLPLTEKEVHEVNWGARGMASDATRYGNFAMEHLINMILKNGGRKMNLRAKIFGGGKVLKKMTDVGERNIEAHIWALFIPVRYYLNHQQVRHLLNALKAYTMIRLFSVKMLTKTASRTILLRVMLNFSKS
jgi:chemotaxis protein CheD